MPPQLSLANIRLGVSPGTGELILYEQTPDGSAPRVKRLMTWETMRAVVEYLQHSKLDSIEVWMQGAKYDLRLSARKVLEPEFHDVPIADQIRVLSQEIAMRKAIYPGLVANKRMTQREAEQGIAAMVAALETVMNAGGME